MTNRIHDNVLYVNGVPTDIVAQGSGGPTRLNVGVLSSAQKANGATGFLAHDALGNALKSDGSQYSVSGGVMYDATAGAFILPGGALQYLPQSVTTKPWIALHDQSDYLTQDPTLGGKFTPAAFGTDAYDSPNGFTENCSASFFGLTAMGVTSLSLANYLAQYGSSYTGIEIWSGNGAEVMAGIGAVPNPGTASMTNYHAPAVTSGNRPNKLVLPVGHPPKFAASAFPNCGMDLQPAGGWRLSMRVTGAINLQARLISNRLSHTVLALNPVTGTSISDDVLTGAGAVQSLDFSNAVKYPSGIDGIILQMYDTIGASCRWSCDGVNPSTARGKYLGSGQFRYIDVLEHGIALNSLKFFLSATQVLRVHAICRMY